ncbi:hypothetical protein XANCAGTX0491_002806 [Xanthoria calcicola]
MAEALGVAASLISLASLFGTCIECFTYYRAAKDCPRQIKTKLVKLDIEKTRLLMWANQVGLVSTDPSSRNPGLERHEANLRQTMEQIQFLLAEANKMQERYGMRQHEQPIAAIEASPDLVSRNNLDTFTASYRRFRGRFVEPGMGPKLTARVRWAILDENKFEGLLKTLKDFVDNLFWLVEVERSIQDHIVEEDIMCITSLLELELIKDASEHDYQVWSDAASRAVERTERGTILSADTDDQDISGFGDEASQGNPEFPLPRVVNPVYDEIAWGFTTPPACFVLTDSCVSFSIPPSCSEVDENLERIFDTLDKYLRFGNYRLSSKSLQYPSGGGQNSLGRKLNTQFRIGNWTREDVQRAQLGRAELVDPQTPFATVFIYVAPCERLLILAFHILDDNRSDRELFSIRIRVDDRLNATCCPPAAAYGRLVALLDTLRQVPRSWSGSDAVDEMWLEQRIQANVMDELQFDRDADLASRYKHLYAEESYNPLEIVGAIVLLGEEDQVREVMSSNSFPRHPHVPRAGEIYAMRSKDSLRETPFARHYLGTYAPNPNLVKKSAPPRNFVRPPGEPELVFSQDQLANGEPSPTRRRVSGEGLAHRQTPKPLSQIEATESSAASTWPRAHLPLR